MRHRYWLTSHEDGCVNSRGWHKESIKAPRKKKRSQIALCGISGTIHRWKLCRKNKKRLNVFEKEECRLLCGRLCADPVRITWFRMRQWEAWHRPVNMSHYCSWCLMKLPLTLCCSPWTPPFSTTSLTLNITRADLSDLNHHISHHHLLESCSGNGHLLF